MATIITCPDCSSTLMVDNPEGVAVKYIKCNQCGKQLMVRFRNQIHSDGAETQLGGAPTSGATQLGGAKVQQLTCFLILDGKEYELQIGPNTVGRKASSSTADVQLETSDLYISRNHALINVRRLPDGNIKVDISNSKNKNTTKINGVILEDGDAFVLHDEDKILLGKTIVTFKTK